jgi:hypothetical protein
MWTWKTEEAAEWSMMTGITNGWIPTPIDAKPHGLVICVDEDNEGLMSTVSHVRVGQKRQSQVPGGVGILLAWVRSSSLALCL